MSSFKRRVPAAGTSAAVGASSLAVPSSLPAAGKAAAGERLPDGVRPSPTSSLPQPLLSSGISALDDLVAGRGMPSGTSLLLLPEDYTQPLATSRASSLGHPLDPWTLAAAEPYTELILAYGIAQGIAHRHVNIVIGEQVEQFCQTLMARVGDDVAADKDLKDPHNAQPSGPSQEIESEAREEEKLKIAFRYANLPVLNSGSSERNQEKDAAAAGTAASEFPSTFDLSRRMSAKILECAREDGLLHFIELSQGGSNPPDSILQSALQRLEDGVAQIREDFGQGANRRQPVVRIHVRALGSPAWNALSSSAALVAFLLKIKTILRSLTVGPTPGMAAGSATPTTFATATISLSSHALLRDGNRPCDIAQRLSHLADTSMALSSFDARPSLRHLLVPAESGSKRSTGSARASKYGYTGAIRILRSAAGIGGWSNEVVRASVLRGMSSSAGSSSFAGATSGSASSSGGAGENDLAFRVGRKKLTVELLNIDDIGLARRDEQESRPSGAAPQDSGSDVLRKMEELRLREEELRATARAATNAANSPSLATPVSAASSQSNVETTSPGAPSNKGIVKPGQATASPPNPARPPAGRDSFKLAGGLASLRARGLAARAASAASPPPSSRTGPNPIALELEGGVQQQVSQAASPVYPARKAVFEKKPEQLEF